MKVAGVRVVHDSQSTHRVLFVLHEKRCQLAASIAPIATARLTKRIGFGFGWCEKVRHVNYR